MTSSSISGMYFKEEYQQIIITGFKQYHERIHKMAEIYFRRKKGKHRIQGLEQLAHLIIFEHLFGLQLSEIYSILDNDCAPIIKEYLSDDETGLVSRSWSYKLVGPMYKSLSKEFDAIISEFQDFFYVTVGDTIREAYIKFINNNKKKITPPIGIFIGLVPPSLIFPNMDVYSRGIIIPFLNARIYLHVNQLSGTSELVGKVKEPELVDGELKFKLAGELGFITGPPGLHKFYEYFRDIERNLGHFEEIIDNFLGLSKVHDLTVVSVDSTNIPMDNRDQSASNGNGSKGDFFGHKASISAGTNCLPISSVTVSGRTHDLLLYNSTILEADDLADRTGQDIWVKTADAAYSSSSLIDDIIASESIPIIDINKRTSPLLGKFKRAVDDLAEISKKAIKEGLTKKERKLWLKEAQKYSEQNGGKLTYAQKKKSFPKF